MTVRLRDQLPLRIGNAVTLARRALQCERLEARCLLHGLPLAIDYEADAEVEARDAAPVPVLIGQILASEPVVAPIPTEVATGSKDPTQSSGNAASQSDASTFAASEVAASDVSLPQVDALPVADRADQAADANASPGDVTEDVIADAATADEVAPSAKPSDALAEHPPLESPPPSSVEELSEQSGTEGDNSVGAGSDDAGSDEAHDDGLPEPEGEAMLAPPQLSSLNSASSLAAVATSASASDTYLTARDNAPSGEGSSSLPVSRIAAAADLRTGVGTLSDSLPSSSSSELGLTEALSLSNEDSLQPATSGPDADRSAANANNTSLSLSAEMPAQSLPAQSLQPHSLPSNRLQTQSLEAPGVGSLSDASVSWLSNSVKLASAFAGAQSALWDERGSGSEARAFEIEQAANFSAPTIANDASESPDFAASSGDSDDHGRSLNDLRAAIEHNARERRAERAVASDSMPEEVARHARRHIQRAYLRVREGSDGLVELAIEHSPALAIQSESTAPQQQSAPSERGWVFASMGLYREFDLSDAADQPSHEPPGSVSPASGSSDGERDNRDVIQAVDAAHADGSTSEDAPFTLGRQALPLGLLALTGLLAVSRHRFSRKQRHAEDA